MNEIKVLHSNLESKVKDGVAVEKVEFDLIHTGIKQELAKEKKRAEDAEATLTPGIRAERAVTAHRIGVLTDQHKR